MHLDHDHDETVHTHAHTHADGVTHTHAHTHTHDHEDEHTHSHDDGGQHGILHRGGHAGAERDVQHVALLQQRIEEGFILEFVQLRGGRQLSLVQKAVESRQRRGPYRRR